MTKNIAHTPIDFNQVTTGGETLNGLNGDMKSMRLFIGGYANTVKDIEKFFVPKSYPKCPRQCKIKPFFDYYCIQ